MRESFKEKSARCETIAKLLVKMYPRRKTVLTFSNPWECLVAVQLSAQCTDKRVNIVTPELFHKYQNVSDYAAADVREFEKMIHSTGFYHNKTKNILGAARIVVEKFGGVVPSTMDELLTLPGVARKSANVILFNAFGIVDGVAVDTHVKRITKLLGLVTADDPVKIERELMKLLPREYWALFSLLITEHGREICIANRPKCGECGLKEVCPFGISKLG